MLATGGLVEHHYCCQESLNYLSNKMGTVECCILHGEIRCVTKFLMSIMKANLEIDLRYLIGWTMIPLNFELASPVEDGIRTYVDGLVL